MSAVQSRPCPPPVRAGNSRNSGVTRPSCLSLSGLVCPLRESFGTTVAQENHPNLTPQTALVSAQRDDLPKPTTETLSAVETALETTLETVSAGISASGKEIPPNSAPRLQPTPFRRRLPRFTRVKRSHRPPLALQDRDRELLRTVADYRLISTPQLLRLFDDESRDGIYRRLQRLFHHDYLDRLGTNPNAPLRYGLGRRGAEILGVSRRKDVSDPYVDHQLMIGDFRVALTRATRTRQIALSWRTVPAGSPVKPDGFFGLQFPDRPDRKNRAVFFLEADRSTMTRDRFVEKLLSYWRWYRTGGHTEKLRIKGFRILTVDEI